MKKQAFFLIPIVALLFVACQNDANVPTAAANVPTTESAQTPDASVSGQYAVNVVSSVIEWTGSKASGSQHQGTISLKKGLLNMYQGNITGGEMTLDMNSITVTDLEGEDKASLEGHLKDADFFEVEKFPTGMFEFGSTMAASNDPSGAKSISAGTLTLKGITKAIRIPFNVYMSNGNVMVETPEFVINRTEWDIKYRSGLIGTVQDKLIDDFVKIKIKLEAELLAQ